MNSLVIGTQLGQMSMPSARQPQAIAQQATNMQGLQQFSAPISAAETTTTNGFDIATIINLMITMMIVMMMMGMMSSMMKNFSKAV